MTFSVNVQCNRERIESDSVTDRLTALHERFEDLAHSSKKQRFSDFRAFMKFHSYLNITSNSRISCRYGSLMLRFCNDTEFLKYSECTALGLQSHKVMLVSVKLSNVNPNAS